MNLSIENISITIRKYYLGSLVSDGETAEHPGRHAGLGGDVLPAH